MAVVRQWEALRSINLHCRCTLPPAYPAEPISSSLATTAPESFKPPTSPTHARGISVLPHPSSTFHRLCLKPVAVASTPRRMQRARAAMTRHARPTTILTHRIRVPAQDTANGTPRRIKKPTRIPCAPRPPLPARGPCAHDDDDATVDDGGGDSEATSLQRRRQWQGDIATAATMVRRHRHGGDDGEATSPRRWWRRRRR
ncbi:hypothetical protein EDB83DRAFT_2320559 [Lactarius deliciosus]|nr:hypothetical protein EDB83DRAFT_2320559 [Lactarius deliciosus]